MTDRVRPKVVLAGGLRDHSEQFRAGRNELLQTVFEQIELVWRESDHFEDRNVLELLRQAIVVYVDYNLASFDSWDGGSALPVPKPVVDLARQAAYGGGRNLAALLRCHVVASTFIWDYVLKVVDSGVAAAERTALLQRAGFSHGRLLDDTLNGLVEHYVKELEQPGQSMERRRARIVDRILRKESVDVRELAYEFDTEHVCVILSGPDALSAIRDIGASLGCVVLCIRKSDVSVCGWLGTHRRLDAEAFDRWLDSRQALDVQLAIGEQCSGIDGFRLTHRQALAASRVSRHLPQRLTRYADVALLASALQDDELARSFTEIYLTPLGEGSGKEEAGILRQTLEAYFSKGRNAVATAAALGVDRRTVSNRLRKAEQRLGRRFHTCQAELELALRLERIREDLSGVSSREGL